MWKRGKLAFALLLSEVLLIIIFALRVEYDVDANASNPMHSLAPAFGGLDPKRNSVEDFYQSFSECQLVVNMALGLSFSYFTTYTFSSIGYNFLVITVSSQWALIFQNLWQLKVAPNLMRIDIKAVISALRASLAVGISLGAVHGKTSPLQYLIFSIIEVLFYTVNEALVITVFQATDVGGGMRTYAFGAYFGVGTSLMLWKYTVKSRQKRLHTDTVNQLFVLLSMIWIFCLWPSFNAAFAIGDKKHRVVINTYLSLTSAAVTSYALSSLFDDRNRFSIRLLQMGIISGAVSMSSISDLMIQPYGALIIGSVSAFLSISTHLYLSKLMVKYFRVQDMFFINNSYGIPSILSGLLSSAYSLLGDETHYGYSLYGIFPARAPPANSSDLEEIQLYLNRVVAGDGRSQFEQAFVQLFALFTTLCISLMGGILTGTIIRLNIFDPRKEEELFCDNCSWILPVQEETYIGNESNCEAEASQTEDVVNVQTLKLPQVSKSSRHKQSI